MNRQRKKNVSSNPVPQNKARSVTVADVAPVLLDLYSVSQNIVYRHRNRCSSVGPGTRSGLGGLLLVRTCLLVVVRSDQTVETSLRTSSSSYSTRALAPRSLSHKCYSSRCTTYRPSSHPHRRRTRPRPRRGLFLDYCHNDS